ncbi:MAG: 7-carboxy-7-deazaguanine synthase QueE [Bacteroidetes bacterium]|nr:7-carboxy-7-deazaguanine synthase QueE [Bacteroidota bacterium]
MEEFYSLQGEGFHTGKAAWFARIGGCDVGCHWCDIKESWNADKFPLVSADEIIRNAAACVAKSIVITGGEPLLYNLDYLCDGLHREGISTFLETSGSSTLSGTWDWICLSPKIDAAPLPEILLLANELKVIVEDPEDFSWAEENASQVSSGCILFLQPEWSRREVMIPAIVEYIQHHPQWRISLQSHKYMRIP